MTSRSSRSGQPPGLDWEDSFHTLDGRYRQLQKQLNAKEEELKQWKVAARRAAAAPPATAAGPHSQTRTSLRSPTGGATASASRARASLDRQSGRAPRLPTSAMAARDAYERRTQDSFSWPPPGDDARDQDEQRQGPPPTSRLYADREAPSPQSSGEAARRASDSERLYVPVSSRAQPDAARAATLNEASMWGPESMLPDPSLIWGAEGSIQNYVAASALYHANEEMRRKLTEATTTIQSQQQELSATRTLVTNMQAKTEDVTQQMHQLVRERDLATQKLTSAKLTNADLERALQNHVSEQEKIRFGLESQVTELRSRLVVGTDSNEQLSRDVRGLLNETRERSAEAMTLRSKLALVESAFSSQKNTNENLLVELKSLNHQLIEERKRILSLSRDIQLSGLDQDRIAALQDQLQRVKSERDDYEREHVRLMSEFVHITEGALQQARAEARTDLQDWREAATHWEEVSQLLYKDIAERTQAHVRCREECEEAKAMRDAYNTQLNSARADLQLCRAKLDVVWPSHAADTQNLSAEDIRNAFGQQQRVPFMQTMMTRRQRKSRQQEQQQRRRRRAAGTQKEADAEKKMAGDGETSPAPSPGDDRVMAIDKDELVDSHDDDGDDGNNSSSEFDADEALWALPLGTDGDAADQLRELHEANVMLLAELQQLRVSNELLESRVDLVADQYKSEKHTLEAEAQSLGSREAASQRLLEQQLDRVAFLEAQVQSLRGYSVETGAALDSLAPTENVLELFLGQLVSTAAPPNPAVSSDVGASDVANAISANTLLFDRFFCSADFLVHEAVVTPTITGLNGFFDTTASFRIAMDALLVYYLQTRDLIVQLHRVRSEEEVQRELQREEAEQARQRRNEERAADGDAQLVPRAASEHSSTREGSTGSSERMAARLYETVAEGRVSLLDLVLDERTRQSPRPTYKSHVRLVTPNGQHLASMEFQVTARAAFTEDFRQLVTRAFADAELSGGLAAARRPNTTLGGALPSTSARAAAKPGRAADRLQNWMSSTSSTASSTPRRHCQRPVQSTSRGKGTATTGLQLYPTSHGAQELVRGWTSTASYTSSTSSVVNDSSVSGRGASRAPRRTLLQATRTTAPAAPPARAASTTFPVTSDAATTTTTATAAQTAQPAPPPFVHVPVEHAASMGTVQAISVEVERVELAGDAGLAQPPRLSCLYLLPAAGQDVRLVAPSTPRYTIEFANARNTFNVVSLAQLSELTREPLTFFLVDEDGSAPAAAPGMSGAGAIYALAVCEWGRVLEHVNTPQNFRLPLLRRETYEVVPGAALVITLTAYSTPVPMWAPASTEPASYSVTSPVVLSTASRVEATQPLGPAPSQPAASAPTPAVGTTAAPPVPPPLPVPPGVTPSAVAPPPSTVHSMEQAMMQLDWQRML